MQAPPSTAAAPNVDPEKVTTTNIDDLDIRVVKGKVYAFPDDKPLYTAHGKWAWANTFDFLSVDPGTSLGHGLEGHVNLKNGHINDRRVVYISKLTSVWDSWRQFFASLYLNASSKYLRPLQGDCVPWIIGVRHCLGGRVGVAQDLPDPVGWREADMFLEESQKEAVIAAYQKVHNRGILHGDVEYRHMLIGDDGKVTIIDFGLSRVLNPDDWDRKAGLEGCSRACLRKEMRKVKFLLDWKDSRETEFRLARLRSAREEKDCAIADAVLKGKTDPFEIVEVPETPMSVEEKVYPDGGLRQCDLDAWSYGDTWVAHRYNIIWVSTKAKLTKTEVPRPPIPAKKMTKETEKAPEERNSVNGTGKAVSRKFHDTNEPTRKRQRTMEMSSAPSPISAPESPTFMTEEHDFEGSMRSSTSESSNETDVNDRMKIPLLNDDAADPTPYDLDPEARAFLRGEAARGFARFITANTRVQPLERQLDQENHNLEKRRSELLRVMLMLPREDRTTIWTNMGQPDARTLLGLLPEPLAPVNGLAGQRQLEHTEGVQQSSGSNAIVPNGPSMPSGELDQGLLAAQKVQAKASSKQKLQKRLEIEREKDSVAMPPPPRTVCDEAGTSRMPPGIPQRPSMASISQRNASRQGSTSQSSPSTSGRSNRNASPDAEQLTTLCKHAYYAKMREDIEEARKAHPDGFISVSIPPEVLAWEDKETRAYPVRRGSSTSGDIVWPPPVTRNHPRLPPTEAPTVVENPREFDAKRKREDTEDSQTAPAADGGQVEQPDPKRRKTGKCDLV